MELSRQITELLSDSPIKLEEAERSSLLQASYKLSSALENPFEKLRRLAFTIYDPIVLRIACDLNLADIALANGGSTTLSELAEKSKADPNLIQRILRILIPLGIFVVSDDGVITATPLAPVLATGSPMKEAIVHLTHLYHSIAVMPEYFAANGYQNPKDAYDGPFNLAENCKGETYFTWVHEPGRERLAQAFNATMELQKGQDDAAFIETYPAQERLKIDDAERVLFVDVGGNLGHQARKFHEKYPSLPGKLIVEDLPQVVDKAVDLPESITKVGHDFFTPQPDIVKGAKAFYLRMVLHDWPEMQARTILSHIVNAMADDSVVLIHEGILPETDVDEFNAKMDWHMMNMSALERTEKQWRELADSVGLEIKGIWLEGGQEIGRRGLIEMGKKA